MDTVPLTTMLSWTWTALAIESDNAFEVTCSGRMRRPFRISLSMWANGLRCIEEDGTTVAELRSTSGAACNLAGLERWGWIVVDGPREVATGTGLAPAGRRAGYGTSRGIKGTTVLRPTRAGSFARRT